MFIIRNIPEQKYFIDIRHVTTEPLKDTCGGENEIKSLERIINRGNEL